MNVYEPVLQEDCGYRYIRVQKGDKYYLDTEEDCNKLKDELYSLGIKTNIGCNNGRWSVCVIEEPEEMRILRIANCIKSENNKNF